MIFLLKMIESLKMTGKIHFRDGLKSLGTVLCALVIAGCSVVETSLFYDALHSVFGTAGAPTAAQLEVSPDSVLETAKNREAAGNALVVDLNHSFVSRLSGPFQIILFKRSNLSLTQTILFGAHSSTSPPARI